MKTSAREPHGARLRARVSRSAERRGNARAAAWTLALLSALVSYGARGADAFEVMRRWGDFQTFCRLIERAELVDSFRASGPITVFAPTDAAFRRLDPGVLAALETPANRERLRALLRYHIVPARLGVFEMRREEARVTSHGKTVRSLLMNDAMMVNDAFIDIADIAASNGLVHGIDKMLTPPP